MIGKKLLMPVLLGSALCMAQPGMAQNGAPQKAVDPNAVAEALKNCPGLNGKLTPQALIEAARNCPGLNGAAPGDCPALSGKIDPMALAQAAANCPALNGSLPPGASKCPGLKGGFVPAKGGFVPAKGGFVPAKGGFVPAKGGFVPGKGGFVPNPDNAPGKDGPQAAMDKKIDKKMNRIVKALERNKRSADILIQAAREAGADPNAISDMEKMSAAFRQVFMSTVSPQQIVESIIAAPAPAEPAGQGIIITGPDGTTWLVTPNGQNVQPQGAPQMQDRPMLPKGPRGQKPPKQMQGGSSPDMQAPPRGLPPQGMQPQGFRRPPPPPAPQPGMAQPQPPAPQGELIIMEETITPEYLPLWPSKDDLGKDGVLKYLEKRSSAMSRN